MAVVAAANGKMVPGLANRNGHRNETAGRSIHHGGKRIKGTGKEAHRRWLHVDARAARNEKQQGIITKYAVVENND